MSFFTVRISQTHLSLSMFCSLAIFTAKYWDRVDIKQILSHKMAYEIELFTCVAPSLCA